MTLPKKVLLREDGPREGFQALPQIVPTSQKLQLIEALASTGISSIEVTAFVRPDRVPQHADADAVAAGLTAHDGVRYRALYLNEKGFTRSLAFPLLQVEGSAMIAVSESFLKLNNNRSIAEAISDVVKLATLFENNQIRFERLMVSTCFGDEQEGRKTDADVMAVVNEVFAKLEQAGKALPEEVTFADTTGWGNPSAVERLIGVFTDRYPNLLPGLHLHDTRGTGMANVYAGLRAGVARFDCSVAGLGGCPFIKDAAGNVPTEDVAFLCSELGIETGVDLARYIETAKLAETITGCPLPGKFMRGGVLGKTSKG